MEERHRHGRYGFVKPCVDMQFSCTKRPEKSLPRDGGSEDGKERSFIARGGSWGMQINPSKVTTITSGDLKKGG